MAQRRITGSRLCAPLSRRVRVALHWVAISQGKPNSNLAARVPYKGIDKGGGCCKNPLLITGTGKTFCGFVAWP